MQRVVHPVCDSCGINNPEYESKLFGIRMCYQCIRAVARWLIHRDLADENPFAEELLDGVWEGSEQHQFLVWHESTYDSRAHSQTWVRRPNRVES